MSAIDKLRALLAESQRDSLTSAHTLVPEAPFHQEMKRLRSMMAKYGKEAGADRGLDDNRTVRIVESFAETRQVKQFMDTRVLCTALTQPIGPRKIILIEVRELFEALMEQVMAFIKKPSLFRRLYRALLSSYLNYSPSGSLEVFLAKPPFENLKVFLKTYLGKVTVNSVIGFDWLTTVNEHRNLFEADPTTFYAHALASQDEYEINRFESLKRSLQLSSNSWVVKKTIAGYIEQIAGSPDNVFLDHLPKILEMLSEKSNAILVDVGLKHLLTRYHRLPSANANAHPGLLNFAVAHWKNPWLDINDSRWHLVDREVKDMVSRWLKRDLVKQFFEDLSENTDNDKRRLAFWQRIIEHSDGLYFALGRHAMHDRSLREIRQKMEGLLLSLQDGNGRLNAFIIIIRDRLFIEFSHSGNALYYYRYPNGLPFKLDPKAKYRISDLRDSSLGDRFIHTDSKYTRWETKLSGIIHEMIPMGRTAINYA